MRATTFEPAATRSIEDLESLKAISDPIRMRILEELTDRELSVSEVAEALSTTRHRLYYHFRILEKLDLVRCVSTRTGSGIEERVYRASARQLGVSDSLSPSLLSGTVAAVFDASFREAEAATRRTRSGRPRRDRMVLVRTAATLTPEEYRTFVRRLQELVSEFDGGDGAASGGKRYGLLVALSPVVDGDPAPTPRSSRPRQRRGKTK
ncbi:MAG TPA: helix-turn-helix domain-containing protein [Actinomycetota bacterium]|nr:helix-turn-helix domain-containing protein [Actinomycetota bacterium]